VTVINSLYIIKDKIRLAKEEKEKEAAKSDSQDLFKNIDADYEKKKEIFNILFRERYKNDLERIQKLIVDGVRRWREQKKYENIQLIAKFLTDLAETYRIPLAVSKFKNSVVKVQRTYRRYMTMKDAQKFMNRLQLERFIEKKVQKLERDLEKQMPSTGKTKPGTKPQPMTLNKMISSATLGLHNSKIIFDLVAQKEEIKKISRYVFM